MIATRRCRAADALRGAPRRRVIVMLGDRRRDRPDALSELGRRDVNSLLLEGGATLAGAFLDAGEIDELRLFIAPIAARGRRRPPLRRGAGAAGSAEAHRAARDRLRAIGRRTSWSAHDCGSGRRVFTGIVRELGERRGDRSLGRPAPGSGSRRASPRSSAEGDSVSVSGRVPDRRDRDERSFEADVMNQTLSLTTLGDLEPGGRVNLEPALRAGDPLGGHLVQGHVDGVGRGGRRRGRRLRPPASCRAPARPPPLHRRARLDRP